MWLTLVTTNDYDHIVPCMQPSDTQLTGVPQQIIIDPNTGLPQDVIIIQQPSSGPKIIGILVMIYGAFGILDVAFNLGNLKSASGSLMVISFVNIATAIGFVVGGYMIQNYQQRGVHLSLLCLSLIHI